MASSPNSKLDSIKIQTARLLEIYALLRRQLKEGDIHLPREKQEQFSAAIRTIARNMVQLQSFYLAQQEEETSKTAARQEVASRAQPISAPAKLHALASGAGLTPEDPAFAALPVSPAELQEVG